MVSSVLGVLGVSSVQNVVRTITRKYIHIYIWCN